MVVVVVVVAVFVVVVAYCCCWCCCCGWWARSCVPPVNCGTFSIAGFWAFYPAISQQTAFHISLSFLAIPFLFVCLFIFLFWVCFSHLGLWFCSFAFPFRGWKCSLFGLCCCCFLSLSGFRFIFYFFFFCFVYCDESLGNESIVHSHSTENKPKDTGE